MAEYAGYISPESRVDWAKAFGGLAQKISDVGTGIKKEREALDTLQRDNETLVNSYEPGKSQTLNEMVIRGANDIKGQMKSWNDELKSGRLKPDEYKRRMENVKEYWGTLANSAKTFDQRFQDSMNRQLPDENNNIPASAFEMELLNRFGQMADISNNSVQVGTDGRLYMVKKDADGKIVGDIMDIRTMNSPDNIVSNRIDVASNVDSLVKNWEPWSIWKDSGKGGEVTIDDVRNNKEVFGPLKAQVAETIASDSNPRAQISVLVDNGVMDANYYIDDNEYNQKRQEAIDEALQVKRTAGLAEELSPQEIKQIEFNLVKVEKDAKGIINPILTQEQKDAAKKRVLDEVEIQLGRKVSGTPQRVFSPGRGGGVGSQQEDVSIAGWQLTQDAMNTVPIGSTSVNDTTGVLTTLGARNPGYKFRKTQWPNGKTGIVVSKYDEDKDKWVVQRNILNARELAPYIYGTSNIDKALSSWDAANEQQSGSTAKPKATSIKYNIKGKTYTLEQLQGMGYTEDQVESYKVK